MRIIVESYIVAVFIFIHLSLLLCVPPTCSFKGTQILLVPKGFHDFLVKIFELIPIKLETIQLVAQFCLFGDLILIAWLVLKLVGNLLKNLLTILGITFVIMLIIYIAGNYEPGMGKLMINQSIEFVTKLINQHKTATKTF